MDKGAHFCRADFQVHSPRDRNWQGGPRPENPDERLSHAMAFIVRCRELGIKAIAITDHHDIEFIKYFQYAAMDGTPPLPSKLDVVDPLRQNPIVFPGIELTLSVACQAIVLLDPECTEDIQGALLNVLGKRPHDPRDPVGPQVDRLSHDNFGDLDALLRQHDALRERYIILPNVNDRGEDTCLRVGYGKKYAAMPCFGAYVDGLVAGHQKIHILDGKDHNWGNKAVGVFQTSDHRAAAKDYTGRVCTWVKIAVPTTEALRQVCLARQSRIRQEKPQLPGIYIQRLRVSDSIFLGPVDLEFNQQFNALVGGRGSGKSSILEYIRHAMQDQPPGDPEKERECDEVSEKRWGLIDTLVQKRASVTIDWVNNGVPHVVSFAFGATKPMLKLGEEDPVETTAEQLRSLLPFQAYSQKQLSTVGTRERELRRFIEQPIQPRLTNTNARIAEKRHELEQLYDRLTALSDKSRAAASLKTQLRSVQEQAKAAEDSLSQLSPQLQNALKEHPLRLREKQAIEDGQADLASAKGNLETGIRALSILPRQLSLEDATPQRNLVLGFHARLEKAISDVREVLRGQVGVLEEVEKALANEIARWQVGHDEHDMVYKSAEEGAKEHKQKLDLIKQCRTQEAAFQKQIGALEREIGELSSVRKAFDLGWRSWVSIHRERGDALEEACKMLTEKSGGEIEAELLRGADYEKALGDLKDLLKKCNIRESNWDELAEYLKTRVPADAWMQLMEDLRPLGEMANEDIPADDTVPKVSCWSLTPGMRRRIVERLKPSRRWVEVALTTLEDLPVFYYKPAGADRIKFKNASAGQQATALLKVLLKETTGPLIIDQPEDDLDSATIQQIAEELWTAKERRQIIFSSHNANIVVNGDAELVVHCAYRQEGDQTKGHIAGEGAIDIPEIREAIQEVMEGGKKAFQLRRQKYGF